MREVAMDMTPVATDATADANTQRRARLLAVAGATGAALALWTVVKLAFGLDLRGPAFGASTESSDVGPAQVVIVGLLASLAGWGLLAVLERFTSRVRHLWALVALVVLIGSLGGSLSGTGATTGARAGLVGLHLVVGAVLIPLLYRTSPGRAAASRVEQAQASSDRAPRGSGGDMSAFTDADLRYLSVERVLARIATAGKDGTPHVAPVGWSYNATHDTIDIGGHSLKRTKKYWDVKRSGRAAVVIDDVLAPLQPRGVEVRGRAGAIEGPPPMIRIHPQRIVSWGLDDATRMPGRRNARDVA